jgi:hypothetical protein
MQALGIIFALAVLVEGLIEYFAQPVQSQYKPYVAALLAVVLCVAYHADLLAALGYAAEVPYVGNVLTGLMISRGANYLNDLVSRLRVIQTPVTTVDAAESAPTAPGTPRG